MFVMEAADVLACFFSATAASEMAPEAGVHDMMLEEVEEEDWADYGEGEEGSWELDMDDWVAGRRGGGGSCATPATRKDRGRLAYLPWSGNGRALSPKEVKEWKQTARFAGQAVAAAGVGATAARGGRAPRAGGKQQAWKDEEGNAVQAPAGLDTSVLSMQQLMELMTRDLTPEDYEALLKLDETVSKRTLEESAIQAMACRMATEQDLGLCVVCQEEVEVAHMVRQLDGCGHTFHVLCIDEWLSRVSTKCPVDGLEVPCH